MSGNIHLYPYLYLYFYTRRISRGYLVAFGRERRNAVGGILN